MILKASVSLTDEFTLTISPHCTCDEQPVFSQAWVEAADLVVVCCECPKCRASYSLHIVGQPSKKYELTDGRHTSGLFTGAPPFPRPNSTESE